MKALTFTERLAQRARLAALAREGVLFCAVFIGVGAAAAFLGELWPAMYLLALTCLLLVVVCILWVRAVSRKLEELQ